MRVNTNWFTTWRTTVILAISFVVVSTYLCAPAGLLAIMNLMVAVPIVAVFIVCWRIVRSAISGEIVNPFTGVAIKRDRP